MGLLVDGRWFGTEADWRLFPPLVRFDAVYFSHFKCNLRRIADYHNLSNYLRDLYQVPCVADTVSIDHIKRHYYGSQRHVNPTGSCRSGRSSTSPRRTTVAASNKAKRRAAIVTARRFCSDVFQAGANTSRRC